MFNALFKSRRRRRKAAQPFPPEWDAHIRRNIAYDAILDDHEQRTLRDITRILIAEKWWEPGRNFTITDEIKVTIAAQAAVLLLNLEHNYYPRVRTIIVYETAYAAPIQGATPGAPIPLQGRLGEAHYRGPIILSWQDALTGGQNACDGRNVVYHEFAHALDMQTDLVNGTPILDSPADYRHWGDVMTQAFKALCTQLATGQPRLLSAYAATNPAEFFAVATEAYFEQGPALKQFHPTVYELLNTYYRHDTADRLAAACPNPQTTTQPQTPTTT